MRQAAIEWDGCQARQHGFGEPIEIGVPPQPLVDRKTCAQIRIVLMAAREDSEHVLPIAGLRKCERRCSVIWIPWLSISSCSSAAT